MDFSTRILIPLLWMLGFSTTILARYAYRSCADLSKASSPLTRLPLKSARECKSISRYRLENATEQMEMVDRIEIGKFQDLIILLVDDYREDSESLVQFLTNNNRTHFYPKGSMNETDPEYNRIMRMLYDNVRHYSKGNQTYFIYRRHRESKHNFFEMYFLKELIDNTENVKMSYMMYMTDSTIWSEVTRERSNWDSDDHKHVYYENYLKQKILNSSLLITTHSDFSYLRNDRLLFQAFECLETQILKNLNEESKVLAEIVHTYYLDLEKNNYNDSKKLSHLLREGYGLLSEKLWILTDYLEHEWDSQKVSDELLREFFSSLGIQFPKNALSTLLENWNFFVYIRSATGVKIRTDQLIEPLENIVENDIELSASWYDDLNLLYEKASGCLDNNNITEPKLEAFPKEIYSGADNPEVKEKALTNAEDYIRHRGIKSECIFEKEYEPSKKADTLRLSDVPGIGNIVKLLSSSTPVRSQCKSIGQYQYEDILNLLKITEEIVLRKHNKLFVFFSENYKESARIFAKGKYIFYVSSEEDKKNNDVYAKFLADTLSKYIPEMMMVKNDTLLHTIRRQINLSDDKLMSEIGDNFTEQKEFQRSNYSLIAEKLRDVVDCLKVNLLENSIPHYASIAKSINHHISNPRSDSNDLSALLSELKYVNQTLTTAFNEIYNATEHGAFSKYISQPLVYALKSLQIDIPEDTRSELRRSFNVWSFLHSINKNEYSKIGGLFDPFWDIILDVRSSIEWHERVNQLYEIPSPYWSLNIHANAKLLENEYFELELNASTHSHEEQKILDDVQEIVFGQTKDCVPIEDTMLAEENQTVYKLQLRGRNIRFQDIPNDWYNLCEGEIRMVELFARHKIIVDKDFNDAGRTLEFVAIAPEFSVVGERKILLDGAAGKEQQIAETGQLGQPGTDGHAGLPGGPGGIFIGVSERSINMRMLQISANGGPGGPGQQGGQGGQVPAPTAPDRSDYDIGVLKGTVAGVKKNYDIYKFATGTKGGNGGKGGKGGYPGRIEIHELKNISERYFTTPYFGRSGKDGLGGKGGAGNFSKGKFWWLFGGIELNYCDRYCSTMEKIFVHERSMSEWFYKSLLEDKIKRCKDDCLNLRPHDGSMGKRGQSGEDITSAVNFEGLRDFSLVINDYKNFIRPFLRKSNGTEVLARFYEGLINNQEINGKYGTIGLLEELKGLEEQSTCLKGIVDVFPMYENLQGRVEEYTKHRLDSELTDEYLAALAYAQTALIAISNRWEENFIPVANVTEYITIAKSNLHLLQRNEMKYSIEQLDSVYKEDIDMKMNNAEKIIEAQLNHEVVKLKKLMKKEVFEFIDKTRNLNGDYRKTLSALKGIREKQLILSILETIRIGTVALVPGGKIAAASVMRFISVDGTKTFIPKHPVADTNLGERSRRALEEAELQEIMKQKALIDAEKIKLGSQVRNNSQHLDLEQNMLRNTLEIIESNRTSQDFEFEKLSQEIKKLVQEERSRDKDADGNSSDTSKLTKITSKSYIHLVYENFKHTVPDVQGGDAGEPGKLQEEINSASDNMRKLRGYQEKIYEEIMLVFGNIDRDFPSDEEVQAPKMAALDISKWEVQASLKKVEAIVRLVTQGFKVTDEMNLFIKSLEDTMNLLISMYNQIENHQRELTLASYIRGLEKIESSNNFPKNKALINSVNRTRLIILKNLALIQYNRVYIAFEQFIFPFAEDLTSSLVNPTEFELVRPADINSIDNILFKIISQNIVRIENEIEKVQLRIYSFPRFHQALVRGNKHGGEVYQWKNEMYNEMISDLLSGKEVILSPDVRRFPHHALMIKEIKIGFVARNRSRQEALDKKLKTLNIRMIHMGISYYTCGEKIYSISHDSSVFETLFDTESVKSKKNPDDPEAYMASGFDLVSPFAAWRVRIFPFEGEFDENYLSEFKNEVDLILEAPVSSFIFKNKHRMCSAYTDLVEYYESYVPLTQTLPVK